MLVNGVNCGWTQPTCDTCFAGHRPDVSVPNRIKEEYRDTEKCCMCGCNTRSGLYVRIDPREVPFPAPEDD